MLRLATKKATTIGLTCCNQRRQTCGRRQQIAATYDQELQPASSFATTCILPCYHWRQVLLQPESTAEKKSFNWWCFLLPPLMNFATTFNQGVRRGRWTASGGARDCKLPELQPVTGVAGAATITSEGSCNPRAKFLLHVDPGEKHQRRRR